MEEPLRRRGKVDAWYPDDEHGRSDEITQYRLCRRRCQGVGRGSLRETAGQALHLDARGLRFEGPRVPGPLRADGDFAPVGRQGIRPRQRLGLPGFGPHRPRFRGAERGHERDASTGTTRSYARAQDPPGVGRHTRPRNVRDRGSLRGGRVHGRHAVPPAVVWRGRDVSAMCSGS